MVHVGHMHGPQGHHNEGLVGDVEIQADEASAGDRDGAADVHRGPGDRNQVLWHRRMADDWPSLRVKTSMSEDESELSPITRDESLMSANVEPRSVIAMPRR